MIEPTEDSSLLLPQSGINDEARAQLRQHAIASTFFMAKAVIGFKDMVAPLHLQMSDWIGNGKNRKLGLVPRDHLKTSIWTIADSVRRISRNPNIRILLGNETSTNASHFLRRIEAVFERCDIYKWLFPELIPDWSKNRKWNETEMIVPRSQDFPEATIEAIGVGGAVVSRHYNLIKLDDLVGKEASESVEVMTKTIDWYQYCESLLVSPSDEIQVYGTRWGLHDLYRWMRDNEGEYLDFFHRSIYKADNSPIWPERFTAEYVAHLRRKYGSYKFSCQYLNDPRDPESGNLDRSWLRWYDWDGGYIIPRAGDGLHKLDPSQLRIFMRVDPAISEKPGAARSAIVVDGLATDGRVFLLEQWARRCQPFDMIEKMFDLQQRWNPESVGVESVAYQRILKPVIEAEAARRGLWMNIIELRPDSRERKENRIRGALQPYLKRGLIWVCEDHQEFLEEYDDFPSSRTLDVIDAFAYGPEQWGVPEDSCIDPDENENLVAFEEMPGRSLITGY